MAKISQVSAKYIIHATIDIEGVVDRPDVIGAIFGQTEGLLGADLELRELQRSGRIGRIEVNVDTKSGKTAGKIIIPSSLDKAETSIVGAALEIIQRIGPCNAKIKVENIEDVRVSKRDFVIQRAKELLKNMMDTVLPDSQELADEVAYSVRVMEITEYGRDRLPAGPNIDDADEVIVVEGRADVLNLLKHGFKNVISINGTSVPPSIVELSKRKIITAFVDGDRGGDLIIKELLSIADIDYVTKAPDGKEVEEITKKEIHKALRSRISSEQAKLDVTSKPSSAYEDRNQSRSRSSYSQSSSTSSSSTSSSSSRPSASSSSSRPQSRPTYSSSRPSSFTEKKTALSDEEKKSFKEMLEDLIGTRGAYLLDEKRNILGKVPTTELSSTIKTMSTGVYAIILDGAIDKNLVSYAEKSSVKHIVGMEAKVKGSETKINIVTVDEL